MASFDFGNSFLPSLGFGLNMFGTGVDTVGAYQSALADNYASEWNATVKDRQADLAFAKADVFRQLGQTESRETLKEYRELRGAQRAAYGASGVDVNSGSAILMQAATAEAGVYESQKAQYQRDLQAWEMDETGKSLNLEAQFSRSSKRNPWLPAASSAIGGLTSAFSQYGSWKK